MNNQLEEVAALRGFSHTQIAAYRRLTCEQVAAVVDRTFTDDQLPAWIPNPSFDRESSSGMINHDPYQNLAWPTGYMEVVPQEGEREAINRQPPILLLINGAPMLTHKLFAALVLSAGCMAVQAQSEKCHTEVRLNSYGYDALKNEFWASSADTPGFYTKDHYLGATLQAAFLTGRAIDIYKEGGCRRMTIAAAYLK